MEAPQSKGHLSLWRFLTENKRCRQCSQVFEWVRNIQPVYWAGIIVVTIILYVHFVPTDFWKNLEITLKPRTPLIGMLLFFSFLAVSLIWAAGQRVDAAVFFFFNRRGKRPSWLDRTMRILTELGNSIATALIALLFYYDVSRTVAYAFVLGSLVLWLTVELMKILFGRQRPFAKLENVRVVGMRARGKSFPSGHTGQAFFTATLLSQYFCGQIPLCILIYFVALLVGITRMYMGMHYPRDVLAGATLGTFWGIIGTTVNSQILGLIGLT